jgi:hypothetical protein
LHERDRPNGAIVRIEAKKSATFRDLAAYMRMALNLDGHLSTFKISTGQTNFGAQEVTICGGEYDSDEYASADDGQFGGKKGTTRLSTFFQVGNKVLWEFDIGNPTIIRLKICEVTTTQTPFAPGNLVREVAGTGVANEPIPIVPAGQITFDEAFPSLSGLALTEDTDIKGCFEVGRQDLSPFWGIVWNGGGNLADMSVPAPTLGASLKQLDHQLKNFEHWEDEAEEAVEGFSFAQAFPKLAKFISIPRNKRWIEVGYGCPGSFCRAMKPGGAIWQSPFRKTYDSVHVALMDLEAHLP